jgi:hypothetical protein
VGDTAGTPSPQAWTGAARTTVIRRALIPLFVLAALTLAAGVAAPPAAAAQAPCWKRLLNDWYDGRIDNAYPVQCYRDAIRNLPDDVDAYTEAREDIERALLAAIRASGGDLAPTDTVAPPGDGSGRGGNGGDNDTDDVDVDQDGTPDDVDDDVTAAPTDDEEDEGGLVGFFQPSNADEIPLPLLVLAGLALALLAAAAIGFAARRVQARRVSPPPQAPPET